MAGRNLWAVHICHHEVGEGVCDCVVWESMFLRAQDGQLDRSVVKLCFGACAVGLIGTYICYMNGGVDGKECSGGFSRVTCRVPQPVSGITDFGRMGGSREISVCW